MSTGPSDADGDANGNGSGAEIGSDAEAARLVAVRRFSFVDPQPGDILHRFTRLAAQTFDTAFAALTFVGDETVQLIARHGLDAVSVCRRQGSLFDETVRQDDLVWIADARDSALFQHAPLVADAPRIAFYAGAPLRTPDGLVIGTISVMDPAPRPLADLAVRGALSDFASCAMSEMECWRLNRELETLTVRRADEVRELDLIYQCAPVGLALYDRDLRFVRINQHLADLNGLAIEDHLGRTVYEVLPELATTVRPLFERVFETGQPLLNFEVIGETPKQPGVERVWLVNYYPIPGADGRVEGVAVIVDEVTDVRRAQAVEKEGATRVRHILDGIGALVGLLDVDGRLLEANRMALDFAGLRPEDVLHKPFEETYWWAHSPDVQADLRRAIGRAAAGERVRYDVAVRTGPDTLATIDFHLSPLYDDAGRIINLVPSAVDVSERKKIEAALRDSEAIFRETFEQMAVGMAHVAPDGRWLRVNDRLCEIVGYDRETLLAMTFQDVTDPQDLATDLDNVRRLLAGEIGSYAMEKRYTRADGSTVWAYLTVTLRRDAAGNPDHFIGVVEDIHARKMAEQRLAVVTSELNHRVKNILSTIQSIVRHTAVDSRSPRLFIEALSGRIQSLANVHDFLVRSQWQGAELREIVTGELEPYGLGRVELDGPSACLTPKAALAMCLMVHELATNAAKYGALSREDGGEVTVRWRAEQGDGVPMFAFDWRERGGPPVEPPSARGFGSTLVEKYAAYEVGGEAKLIFAPHGVEVSLRAPLAEVVSSMPATRNGAPPRQAAARDRSQTRPLNVLVVEDSTLIAMDMEAILADAGHAVIGPAASIAEALDLIERGGIDAALLDVDVRGELITPVADRLAASGIRFALVTGYQDARLALPDYGGVPVIRKPFDSQSVLATLAALCPA